MDEQEQNRSEAPSAHKLSRARGKGQVARGMDLSFFAALSAFLAYCWIAGNGLVGALKHAMRDALVSSADLASDPDAIFTTIRMLTAAVERPLAIFAVSAFLAVLLLELLQTGFVFSSEPLRPDFGKLNPARGLKRLFTIRLLVESAKNLLKLLIYTIAGALLIRTALRSDFAAIGDAAGLAKAMGRSGARFLVTYAGIALFFVVVDQIIVRRDFFKRMRMSRRELKQESRDREGDPRLKQRRKQMHAEFVRGSRSIRGLRGADVLVVNPRHIAIALRYDPHTMSAPIVASIGTNQLALRLKRLAFVYGIPVIENRGLARALLRGGAIDHAIPPTSYQPIADIYNRLRRHGRKI